MYSHNEQDSDCERQKGDGFIILLLRDFMRLGLVKEVTGAARNRLYVFESYLDLFLM
jgi:hypothetical protein